jgi:SAM-dependent methyltransferase
MQLQWYEAYERGRPGYPGDVTAVAGVPSTAHVLDLAAGSGKLSRLLASTFGRVVAAEPDDEMRRLLVVNCPDADVIAGSAEHLALGTGSLDAVFAAQCFHLFDRPRAVAESARVLRPGGVLVLLWNVQSGQPQPSLAAVEQLLDRQWPKGWDPLDLGDPIPSRRQEWNDALADAGFDTLHEVALPNPHVVDREGVVAFMHSMGWIATLPDEERVVLLETVRSLLDSNRYVLPWETHVYWAARRAGA